MCALCWSRVGDEQPGGCRFNARWLKDEKYKLWLKRGPNLQVSTCKKDVQLFTMGEAALSSHMKGRCQIQTVPSAGPSVVSIVIADLLTGLNVPCGQEKYDQFILHKVQSRTEIGAFGRVFHLSAKRSFVWMAVTALQTHVLSVLAGKEKQMSSLCLIVLLDFQSLVPGEQPAVEVTDHLSASKPPAGDDPETLAISCRPFQHCLRLIRRIELLSVGAWMLRGGFQFFTTSAASGTFSIHPCFSIQLCTLLSDG
ncbi:hypothetical protein G5714_002805 [Onychostoma macrolepis]|uniref:Uncharacterized protein n=1 Tax=Onychostoma macrolepis TaxID=369639 RepID=A0A7J6D7Q6_9TELE|nr:hypothetical protein G5714_002805 [Onychostoma macrolepis]